MAGIAVAAVPCMQFLWNPWAGHLFFLYILAASALILLSDVLSKESVELPFDGRILAAFALCAVISSAWSPYKESSRTGLIYFFNGLAAFWITSKLSEESRFQLQKVLCVVTAIFAFFFTASNLFRTAVGQNEAREFFLNYNLTASFCILGLFAAVHIHDRAMPLARATILLTLMAFYFTRSLGGLLAIAAGIFYLWNGGRTGFEMKNRKMIGITAGAVFLFLISAFALNGTYGTLSNRIRWWNAAGKIILSHPFLGGGPGTFEKLSPAYDDPGLGSVFAHSFPLQTACELGIPAAVLLCAFFYRRIRGSTERVLVAGVIAVLFQNLFDFALNVPGFFAAFMIFFAMVARQDPETHAVSLGKLKKSIALLLAVCAVTSGWQWGVRPLAAFRETLKAEDAMRKRDLLSAQEALEKSIEWDHLPAKTYSDLSQILMMRSTQEPEGELLVLEAVRLRKEALRRAPSPAPGNAAAP